MRSHADAGRPHPQAQSSADAWPPGAGQAADALAPIRQRIPHMIEADAASPAFRAGPARVVKVDAEILA
ncbi:hypothetical protein GCM10010449_05520 [Streptomyces rectiviolaceus]|uniref:Uncharacterized protein n=1 Tax=Streptomyces rectiviolaceus TaxID=332591 RepID=A0ABP6M9A2_9ACTN